MRGGFGVYAVTRSPFFRCVTLLPTSMTSPATSQPRTMGQVLMKPAPESWLQSVSEETKRFERAASRVYLDLPVDGVHGHGVVFNDDFVSSGLWHLGGVDTEFLLLAVEPC